MTNSIEQRPSGEAGNHFISQNVPRLYHVFTSPYSELHQSCPQSNIVFVYDPL